LQEVGGLDLSAIEQVRDEAWPDVRDPEELHDAMLTLLAIPEDMAALERESPRDKWSGFLEQLQQQRRATRARVEDRYFWVAAEKLSSFRVLYPDAELQPLIDSAERESLTADDARLAMVTGWMMHLGPTNTEQLATMLHQQANEIDIALLRLEAKGLVLRGKFALRDSSTEWCDRRLLARIHRLTLGTLRKQVQPATPAQFMRWLGRWQHLAPGTQLSGERGLLEIVRQLQGFEIPANAWERQILPQRLRDYDPAHLDHLCLTGAVGWGRLSPHPATLEATAGGTRRVVPTSVAPVTFFLREESDWMPPARHQDPGELQRCLSPAAVEVFTYLLGRGASFFADIVRGTGRLKAEVETALWELVAAGVVTADGFDNLRTLISPKRNHGSAARNRRPRHSSGRWTILNPEPARDHNATLEAACRMLLDRYGVVFRELLARESVLPKWRELLLTFRRLEDRGEVRGGRFVSSFIGEQFALPEAVESLRAIRNAPPAEETITVSAADPMNLVGIIVPGERVPAISGNLVSFRDGAAVETRGEASPVLKLLASANGD